MSDLTTGGRVFNIKTVATLAVTTGLKKVL
jgi:hypothetical protein